MVTTQAWHKIVTLALKVPGERQRLATSLGISSMTLTRWASGESQPQRPHLIRLVQTIGPHYRDDLIEALETIYPEIHSLLKEEIPDHIPSSFYSELLSIRTTTTESLRFWRISDLILKQFLLQLDPNQLGMSVTIIQCMPPAVKHGSKIRSLRERVGRGTSPWTADLEHISLFLGLESLGGYTSEARHIVNVDDLSKDKLLPAYQDKFEVSAAAHPIMLGGRIAGCLSASSTQVGYFTQQRQALLMAFSDLASLAFDKSEFYDPKLVELRVMPKPAYQRPIIDEFRFRVSQTLMAATYQRLRLTNQQAEQQVWSEIEDQLLSLPDEAYMNWP